MAGNETKVVGYFAHLSQTDVVCTGGNACVVAGSTEAMQEYLADIGGNTLAKATVKKTRFGEILRGLALGAAFAFDKESYERFYPMALREGIPVEAGTSRGTISEASAFSRCG